MSALDECVRLAENIRLAERYHWIADDDARTARAELAQLRAERDGYRAALEKIDTCYVRQVETTPSMATEMYRIADLALSKYQSALKCPECDSDILPTGYCMMDHWCGPSDIPVIDAPAPGTLCACGCHAGKEVPLAVTLVDGEPSCKLCSDLRYDVPPLPEDETLGDKALADRLQAAVDRHAEEIARIE